MIKVTRVVVPSVRAVVIELDANKAQELREWLGNIETPRGIPFELWDTLDDVLREGKAESIRI